MNRPCQWSDLNFGATSHFWAGQSCALIWPGKARPKVRCCRRLWHCWVGHFVTWSTEDPRLQPIGVIEITCPRSNRLCVWFNAHTSKWIPNKSKVTCYTLCIIHYVCIYIYTYNYIPIHILHIYVFVYMYLLHAHTHTSISQTVVCPKTCHWIFGCEYRCQCGTSNVILSTSFG